LFDLLIKHILSLSLFLLKSLHYISSCFLSELKGVLYFLDLFTLSVELSGLLFSFSHSAALELSINVAVLLVDLSLLSEDVSDLVHGHFLESIEVLDAALSDRDVNVDLVVLLLELHDGLLLFLEEVLIFKATLLFVQLDVVLLDVFVEILDLSLELVLFVFLLFSLLIALVEHLVARYLSGVLGVLALDIVKFLAHHKSLGVKHSLGVALVVELCLHVLDLLLRLVLVSLESLVDLVELSLEYLDLMLFVFVVHLFLADFLVEGAHVLVELVAFIVELVLQGEEVLVEGDTVAQEGLITASFVLLVDFAVLQELYLVLHQHDLLLHVQDVLLLKVFGDFVSGLTLRALLLHFVGALEVGVALEFLVADACLARVFVCIRGSPSRRLFANGSI
jgi:hypothetical protein